MSMLSFLLRTLFKALPTLVFCLLFSLSFQTSSAYAAHACSSVSSGGWSTPATWGSCGGGVPGAGDSATINLGHVVTLSQSVVTGDLDVEEELDTQGWNMDVTSVTTGAVSVGINATGAGGRKSTITVRGFWSENGFVFGYADSTVIFSTNAGIDPTRYVLAGATFNNVIFNNARIEVYNGMDFYGTVSVTGNADVLLDLGSTFHSTFSMDTGTLNAQGDVSIDAATVTGGNMLFAGNLALTNDTNFSCTGGTTTFNGTTVLTTNGGGLPHFYNVNLAANAGLGLDASTGHMDIDGLLYAYSGTGTGNFSPGNQLYLTNNVDLRNLDVFDGDNADVFFSGTAAQSVYFASVAKWINGLHVRVSNGPAGVVSFLNAGDPITLLKVDAGATAKFTAGLTYGASILSLPGTLSSPVTLQSLTPNSRYTLQTGNTAFTRSYVHVQDSEITGVSEVATNSVDNGNNDNHDAPPHWIISSVATVQRWLGTGTTVWATGTNWSGGSAPSGATQEAYFDTSAQAVTTGVSTNLGQLDIEPSFTGSLTLGADLSVYNTGLGSGDVTIYSGTFVMTDHTLYVSGNLNIASTATAFTANSATTVAHVYGTSAKYTTGDIAKTTWNAASTLDIQSDLNQTLPVGETYGNLQLGRFSGSGSNTQFTLSGTVAGNLIVDADATVYLATDITVAGNVTINGTLWPQGHTINAGGNWTTAAGASINTPIVVFNAGATGKTITTNGTSLASATFNNAS
ncbi:MAG: hypothetical protein HQL19_00280, partial [Candidatus Omnitrophica bacterium]|nr:hypothetical protein [Candidatus Omnitrophota bacterium]